METLSTTLGKKKVQGKITPVPKPKNPYVKQINKSQNGQLSSNVGVGSNIPESIVTALGTAAQTKAKPAVSTEITPYSYESDPILARIKALGQQNVSNAESEAAALRKQAIIESGLGGVGSELGLDASTVQAANENPFGQSQLLAKESQQRGHALDEQLNQGNLFYSGDRINKLGELGFNTAQAQTSLNTDLRKLLGGIDTGVLDARTAAAQAEQDAIAGIEPGPPPPVPEAAPLASILGGETGVPLDLAPYYQSPDYSQQMTPQQIALLLGLSLQGNLPY